MGEWADYWKGEGKTFDEASTELTEAGRKLGRSALRAFLYKGGWLIIFGVWVVLLALALFLGWF